MFLERKQDLSVYYFLVDEFSDFPTLKIVDGFPAEALTLPTVSVEAIGIDTSQLELGNKHRYQTRTWFIDVFAVNKSQRDELAYRILNKIENKISVYDYDEGFPPEVITELGCLIPTDLRMEVIRIFPELSGTLYYRANIILTAVYNKF